MASKANLEQTTRKAVALAQAGKLKQAIPLMEKAVAGKPSDLNARYNLALMLLEDGNFTKAMGHLDAILAKAPTHGPSRFSKAKALLALGRADQALPILQDLAATDDPDCLLALANALRILGRLDRAVSVGERFPPGFLPGQINHGQLLLEIDPERAVAHLDRALRLHASSPEIAALLGQALLRAKQPEAAIQRLRRL